MPAPAFLAAEAALRRASGQRGGVFLGGKVSAPRSARVRLRVHESVESAG